MNAIIKKTGASVKVVDYGEKFHPRYWTKTTGYSAEELEFI
jgi:hypothetical protein